jgi:group I intron endonuclease
MKVSGIYSITSPTNKVYIGLSKDIYKRWQSYRLLCNFKCQKLLHNSIKKYGYENHIFEILEVCDPDEKILAEREIFWIKEKNTYFYNNKQFGLNLSKGGNAPNPQYGPHTKEHNLKISLGNKGKRHNEEIKLKISNKKRGVKLSEIHKQRISQAKTGRSSKLKNTKRPNISKKLKGKPANNQIKCSLLNQKTGEIIHANSLTELSQKTKICSGSLNNLKEKRPTKKYNHLTLKIHSTAIHNED